MAVSILKRAVLAPTPFSRPPDTITNSHHPSIFNTPLWRGDIFYKGVVNQMAMIDIKWYNEEERDITIAKCGIDSYTTALNDLNAYYDKYMEYRKIFVESGASALYDEKTKPLKALIRRLKDGKYNPTNNERDFSSNILKFQLFVEEYKALMSDEYNEELVRMMEKEEEKRNKMKAEREAEKEEIFFRYEDFCKNNYLITIKGDTRVLSKVEWENLRLRIDNDETQPNYILRKVSNVKDVMKPFPISKIVIDAYGKEKEIKIDMIDHWVKDYVNRNELKGINFFPGNTEPVVNGEWNIFSGWGVKAEEGNDDEMYWTVVKEICGNDEYFDYVRKWLAHIFQKPMSVPGTALGLSGKNGNGKTTFTKVIGSLMPRHFRSALSRNDVTGNFNSMLEGMLLGVLDDVTWGGNKSEMGQIKHLITGDKNRIEKKGLDAFEVNSYKRLVFNSNTNFYYAPDKDDRRLLALEVKSELLRKENVEFWQAFYDKFNNGKMKENLLYTLLHKIDLTDFNPIGDLIALEQITGQEMLENAYGPEEEWMYYSLMGKEFEYPGDSFENGEITSKDLKQCYLHFMKANNKHHFPNFQSKKVIDLRNAVFGKSELKKINGNNGRWIEIDWEKFRINFQSLVNKTIDWE